VLDEMPSKNVVSWTTLVGALTLAGHRHDALRRFAEMRAAGVPCDSHACAAALTTCAEARLLPRGSEVHALCAKLGVHAMPYGSNTLVMLYACCGDVGLVGSRDVATWTTVISSYVQSGRAREAIQAFVAMHRMRQRPTTTQRCGYRRVCRYFVSVYLGEQLHGQAAQGGYAGQCPLTRHTLRTRCGSSLGS
jgi:pentatricopeptide repeat protein